MFDDPVVMVLLKMGNGKRRADDELEVRLTFGVRLDEDLDVEMPEWLAPALRAMEKTPGCEELKLGYEHVPVNMRCRPLPADQAPGAVEQFLGSLVWKKLKLVREEGEIELRFTAAVRVNQANWEWIRVTLGTQVWAEVEEAQRELSAAAPVVQAPQGVQ